MSDRFFVNSKITGDQAVLDGPEAHHLAHVMRAEVGDTVTLFDGQGSEFSARVKSIGKSQIQLDVLEQRDVDRELSVKVVLAVALPKGDRQRWLLEKATELGVAQLIPLETQRGVAQPSAGAIEKLRRAVIEACKQCGRNRLLEIAEPRAWGEFAAGAPQDALRLLAHPVRCIPVQAPLRSVLAGELQGLRSKVVIAAVGPEGGFTDQEIAVGLSAGWTAVDLGPSILRVETAAIALAAWASQLT